jgi:hypothetical protein
LKRGESPVTDSCDPDFIIAGTPKCATTWLYESLYEHPEIYLPETDLIHYFNINYHRGSDWYRTHFPDNPDDRLIGEETPSYIRSDQAPGRIYEDLGDVKLMFCVRHPIDRAYSHYWHEKSKDKIEFEFEEIFDNYDLYQNWIEPGLYHQRIERYRDYFDDDNIKLMFFEDLVENGADYLRQAHEFLGVDVDYEPSTLNEKINEARHDMPAAVRRVRDVVRETAPDRIVDGVRPAYRMVKWMVYDRSEYDEGMDPDTRERLAGVFAEDVRALESWTGRDLNHWLE